MVNEMNRRNIVQTDISYTYEILMRDIYELKQRYHFLEIGNIGYTVLGKPIPYIRLGNGERRYYIVLHFMQMNG